VSVDVTERKYRVPEAALMLGISVKTMWNRVAAMEIDVYRIGRSVRIPESALRKTLEEGFQPARQRTA
jgi:excisionase family DNA binding protein